MQENPSEDNSDRWQEVAPLLNDAIASLSEHDRNAIVLRFLEAKDYKAVAAAMGATENAAQMRVSRALDKLRQLFAKRGVVVPVAVLGTLMTTYGTQAAPAGLAASVATTAAQGALATASSLGLLKGT